MFFPRSQKNRALPILRMVLLLAALLLTGKSGYSHCKFSTCPTDSATAWIAVQTRRSVSDTSCFHSGAVATVHEYRGTGSTPLRTITNTYDKAWRLLTETDTPATGPVVVTTFGYSKANNRTSLARTSGGTTVNNTAYSYYAPGQSSAYNSNQLRMTYDSVTGQRRTYSYDLNGNRISDEISYEHCTQAPGDP